MAQRLPTPKAHPILGHAADFASKESKSNQIQNSSKNANLFIQLGFFDRALKWCKEFPMFHKTQILFHPLLLVHSPEAVQVYNF
jgi:hypothetical protein